MDGLDPSIREIRVLTLHFDFRTKIVYKGVKYIEESDYPLQG
jgi:hypothetical protein